MGTITNIGPTVFIFWGMIIGIVPLPKEATIPNFIQICFNLRPELCEQENLDTQTDERTDGWMDGRTDIVKTIQKVILSRSV